MLDLKVTLNDKSIVDVEMQMKNEHNIEQRDTFYLGYKEEDRYMTKYLEVHIIELPKFKIKNPKMHTKLEEWLWLFIGSDEKVSEASKKNKEIEKIKKKLASKIKKKLASMSLSPEERNNYEYRLRAIRDEADAIEYKTKQAKEEGIREGLERGAKRRTEEMVKEMLKNNFTIEQIEIITKLTKEEIERLKNEI